MNQASRLIVNQIDRDRFARSTKAELEQKTIMTPNFSPLIQTQSELDIYIRRMLSIKNNDYLGTFVMRIFDANKLLLPLINAKNAKYPRLDGRSDPILAPYEMFADKTIPLIEPATDYLDFEFHFEKFVKLADTVHFPRQVMTYLHLKNRKKKGCQGKEYNTWKEPAHRKFWCDLYQEPRRLNDMITEYFDLESKFETKILVPPVPFAENDVTLSIAVKVNDMGKALAVNRGECATFFMLGKSVLRNKDLIEKIISYMEKDHTTLTLFKFKNLTLWDSECFAERETFRDLMETIAEIKRNSPKRLFMLLEGGYQCFPVASYAFDIVSSSLRLLDKDSAYGENKGYGGYFMEDKLLNVKYENLPEIMSNNDGSLPCPCPVCRNITYDDVESILKYDSKKISIEMWSDLRREHNLFVMNSLMEMINRAIKEKQIELVRQKIQDSEISNLKTLIPQHYESD